MNIDNNRPSEGQGHDQGQSRIRCGVTNCVYNDSQKYCTARQIKVGPQFASSSADTVCVTFKQ